MAEKPRLDENWLEGPDEEEYFDELWDDGYFIDEDEDFEENGQDGWRPDGKDVRAEFFPDDTWTEDDWQRFFADDEAESEAMGGRGLPRWIVNVLAGLILLAFVAICFPMFGFMGDRLDFLGDSAALRKEPMVQEALPAVVAIVASADDSAVPERSGTGFFVTADGWLLSNAHVTGQADRLRIDTASGDTYFTDQYQQLGGFDIAAIKIEAEDCPYLDIETEIIPRTEDKYTIVGNPLGFLRVATRGPMVGLHYMAGTSEEEWVFELDARIRAGSSGSPVLNSSGEAVGIIFATRFDTVKGETYDTALALPLQQVQGELRELGIIP
ncbi:MAG: serine protease [Syntrophomonadaceae bacterium]|nr:serine protease [Syntrophomonadaceae bacterium]